MSWIKKHGVTLLLILMFLIGVGLLIYPSFSDYWNSFHQSRAIMDYAESISGMDNAEYEAVLGAADAYNKELAENGIKWVLSDEEKERYNSLLDVNENGIMGYIDIPKIKVSLPIYHGTNEAVLQVAIGHLEQTSLPVGGEGTHCVLSGHRGLPSAKLFSDLDRLKEGDTFTMTVLNETLTYEVDQIRIVEPTDLSTLTIEEGKDYVTLVTCTPYGINTHRLLVRAHRIENKNGNARVVADAIQYDTIYVLPFVAAPILLFVLILFLILNGYGSRARKKQHQKQYLDRVGLERPDLEMEELEAKWGRHKK